MGKEEEKRDGEEVEKDTARGAERGKREHKGEGVGKRWLIE